MNPMTPGTAASWWLQLFGGFGTSLTTTAPAADTGGSWEGFAAVLSTITPGAPSVTADDTGADVDPETAGDAAAAAMLVPMTPATGDGSPGTARTTNFAVPGHEAILNPASPSRSDAAVADGIVHETPSEAAGVSAEVGIHLLRPGASATTASGATTDTTPRPNPAPPTGASTPASTDSVTAAALAAAPDVVMDSGPAIAMGGVLAQAGDGIVVSGDPSFDIDVDFDGQGDDSSTLDVLRTSEPAPAGVRVEARDVLPLVTGAAHGDLAAGAAHEANVQGNAPEPDPRPEVFTAQQLQRDLASARTEQQTVTVPATAGRTAETATRDARMDDSLARLRVRKYERGLADRSSASERATDLGARAALRTLTDRSVATAVGATAGKSDPGDLQDLAEFSDESSRDGEMTSTKTTTPGNPTAAVGPTTTASTSDTDSNSRDRVTGLGERQPVLEDLKPADSSPRPTNTAQTPRMQSADLGARLREAVIETMARQARSELLSSTKDTYQATVTVEPAHLGRVNLQVSRGTGGLEVVLVTAHREAAQALDAEVDDLVDELIRRELEPAKVTVRTTDRGLDAERQPARQNPENDPTRSRREQDDTTESGAEERQGRRGRGRDARDQRQATA